MRQDIWNRKCGVPDGQSVPFLLETLSENGYTDLAYELLFQTREPSWLHEVEHGATTIWESCMGYREDKNPLNISMNHYSFGAVGRWIYENINGIRESKPGFSEIRIASKLTDRLFSARRSFCSV